VVAFDALIKPKAPRRTGVLKPIRALRKIVGDKPIGELDRFPAGLGFIGKVVFPMFDRLVPNQHFLMQLIAHLSDINQLPVERLQHGDNVIGLPIHLGEDRPEILDGWAHQHLHPVDLVDKILSVLYNAATCVSFVTISDACT
jgi:hypothetical protein